jgi:hypothetical protein
VLVANPEFTAYELPIDNADHFAQWRYDSMVAPAGLPHHPGDQVRIVYVLKKEDLSSKF